MVKYSTNQVAKKLGIATKSLSRYIAQGKVPAPQIIEVGGSTIHSWTEEEIEKLRLLLPKIANGRKTRYQKLREKKTTAQPRAAVPHKTRKPKKK
jgi:predicted DNA-binding transcriptional regulator AlpA